MSTKKLLAHVRKKPVVLNLQCLFSFLNENGPEECTA